MTDESEARQDGLAGLARQQERERGRDEPLGVVVPGSQSRQFLLADRHAVTRGAGVAADDDLTGEAVRGGTAEHADLALAPTRPPPQAALGVWLIEVPSPPTARGPRRRAARPPAAARPGRVTRTSRAR